MVLGAWLPSGFSGGLLPVALGRLLAILTGLAAVTGLLAVGELRGLAAIAGAHAAGGGAGVLLRHAVHREGIVHVLLQIGGGEDDGLGGLLQG